MNTINISKLIQKKVDKIEIPQLNGFLFYNCEVILTSGGTFSKNGEVQSYAHPLARTNICSILEFNADIWITGTVLDEFEDKEKSLHMICGEGEMGNEGFIIINDLLKNRFKWIGSFTFSNPFEEIYFENEKVCAISTYNQVWKFPIDNPHDFLIMSIDQLEER